MPGFDFPNTPTNGQQVTGPNGAVYTWDGTKWTTSTATAPYVLKAGDTMTGALVLPANASAALQAVPKQQLDAAVAPALSNVGRNLLHNPLFNIAQRGTGPWTTSNTYSADRWQQWTSVSTVSTTIIAASDTNRIQIGDEAATSLLQSVVTGTAGTGDYVALTQPIENVRRCAGKTVTVSFYALSVAGLKLGVSLDQNYGTGGSPTAPVNGAGQAVTLTSSFVRYSLTFTVPSSAGATLGTNGDSHTSLWFWLTAGSALNTRSGGIGQQSGGFAFWGIQLEIGPTMTPLEKLDPRLDLANCQRFYLATQRQIRIAFNAWGGGAYQALPVYFPVSMRAAPVIVLGTSSNVANIASVNSVNSDTQGFAIQALSTAAGGTTNDMAGFTASADL
jgi:hypothetical protein